MMEVGDENTWFTECLRLFVIRHLCDNIVQVYPGIYPVRLTCGQQRTYDRHINRSFVITTEEKIFSAQSDGPLDIFRQIVVPFKQKENSY